MQSRSPWDCFDMQMESANKGGVFGGGWRFCSPKKRKKNIRLSWHCVGEGKKMRSHLSGCFFFFFWSSRICWPVPARLGTPSDRNLLPLGRPPASERVNRPDSLLPPPPPPTIITATYWPVICLMGCKEKVSVSIIHPGTINHIIWSGVCVCAAATCPNPPIHHCII